ncbi:MAG TPA: SCO family protein [Anaeromyxobacter sp.]|nr:SCO family protein [Anaeromyxobacter sp.]
MRRARLAALAAALAAAAPAAARAQFWTRPGGEAPPDVPPAALQDVRIDERLGNRIPLDLELVDGSGAPFALRSAFDGRRPVVLALVYYDCPMLCGLILSGMAKAMRENGLVLGKDFEAVTVSFDPEEKPAQGAERRRGYLQSMGVPDASRVWPFLVGTAEASRALADAVGFHYAKDAATGEWAHLAAIFVLAPDGTVSRYLYGIEYPPKDLRLALVEAADGKVGTSFDRFLLTCYRYDAATRRYEPYALGIVRAGGALVLAALVALIGGLVWRERRAKARQAA